MKTFEELEQLVIQWSRDRLILQNSTPEVQFMKAVSEMGELSDAIVKRRLPEIRDGIGDVLVCLTNVAQMTGLNLRSCLEVAYNEIKDRKGYLNESGVFIKESDHESA